jgi:hypothetical protein
MNPIAAIVAYYPNDKIAVRSVTVVPTGFVVVFERSFPSDDRNEARMAFVHKTRGVQSNMFAQ